MNWQMPQEREKGETHMYTRTQWTRKKREWEKITTTKKMCSNQQPKNRNNVFHELAPTMIYRKGSVGNNTVLSKNDENISVLCF